MTDLAKVESNRESSRRYRERNLEVVRQRDRDRYKRDGEKRRKYQRDYYVKNREAVRAAQATRRASDPDAARAYQRAFYAANKDLYLEGARRRKATLREVPCVPFTVEQLAARLSMFAGCWMCGTKDGPMHVDHVKPVSKGGPHMLANLRPACPPCNLSKKDQWPIESLLK